MLNKSSFTLRNSRSAEQRERSNNTSFGGNNADDFSFLSRKDRHSIPYFEAERQLKAVDLPRSNGNPLYSSFEESRPQRDTRAGALGKQFYSNHHL